MSREWEEALAIFVTSRERMIAAAEAEIVRLTKAKFLRPVSLALSGEYDEDHVPHLDITEVVCREQHGEPE
ncbi:MAG: hypothetical protein M0005_03060 [Actinomycetota bacterium]|nr:hypothetical protein [Actinomycetota bacterium]